jgi:hypothetical protein
VIPGRPPRARSPFFLGRGQKRAPLLHSFVYPVCFCFISLKSFLCCYCSETAIAEVCRLNHVTRHTHTLTQKKSRSLTRHRPATARNGKASETRDGAEKKIRKRKHGRSRGQTDERKRHAIRAVSVCARRPAYSTRRDEEMAFGQPTCLFGGRAGADCTGVCSALWFSQKRKAC